MASGLYHRWFSEIAQGSTSWTGQSYMVALVSSGYTFDTDHEVWSAGEAGPATNEISGTGYTAGGQQLSNPSVTDSDANNNSYVDGDDTIWPAATITARYAVIYDTTHASDILVACFDFGADKSSTADTFTVQWSTAGIVVMSS
jgi:hypothetical protein